MQVNDTWRIVSVVATMPRLEITIYGKPATQRPRIKAGGRGMYNISAVNHWKDNVKTAAFLASREQQVDVPIPAGKPVRADYNFYLPWQKNVSKKKAESVGAHTEKPDLKNLLSHTEDALSEADIWTDDNQVDTIILQKWRVPRGQERTEIVISW